MEGWWKTAFVGQEVVCVRLATNHRQRGYVDPQIGRTYVIQDIELDDFFESSGGVGLNVGVVNTMGQTCIHSAYMFRPVQHRDTSATVAEIIRKSHETPADLELV
jgi:hypothetical protein